MNDKEDDDVTPNRRSKEFLRDLGKRNECYLRLSQASQDPMTPYSNPRVVDDVGCPVANVRSFKIESRPNEGAVLILEIAPISVEIITK